MPNTDLDDVPRICSGCVGEVFLKAEMDAQGVPSACSYCGREGRTYTVEDLAHRIETALEQHFLPTPDERSDAEYALVKDEETYFAWEREGEPVQSVIEAIAEIEEGPAAAILAILQDRDACSDLEPGRFDDEAHYVDAGASDQELHSEWLSFEESLKTEARFFNPRAQEILGRVFSDVEGERTVEGKPVVIKAGPGAEITALFRARTFQSSSRLEEALCRPDLKVGPPPPVFANAGRMNAHGISVFYGATDPRVAVAEVRPPVGSRVVVGRFVVTRPVRLLDVEALRSVLVEGSVFDPQFIGRRERARFLERLSHRISTPVMPDDEAFEYLVTQVIADYLASKGFDGVRFPSAQAAEGKNVVLFHGAARVEEWSVPDGVDISAQLEEQTEDGREVDYSVTELLPPPTEGDAQELPVGNSGRLAPEQPAGEEDPRPVTLVLEAGSLRVHHVQAVTFATEEYQVRRHQFRLGSSKF